MILNGLLAKIRILNTKIICTSFDILPFYNANVKQPFCDAIVFFKDNELSCFHSNNSIQKNIFELDKSKFFDIEKYEYIRVKQVGEDGEARIYDFYLGTNLGQNFIHRVKVTQNLDLSEGYPLNFELLGVDEYTEATDINTYDRENTLMNEWNNRQEISIQNKSKRGQNFKDVTTGWARDVLGNEPQSIQEYFSVSKNWKYNGFGGQGFKRGYQKVDNAIKKVDSKGNKILNTTAIINNEFLAYNLGSDEIPRDDETFTAIAKLDSLLANYAVVKTAVKEYKDGDLSLTFENTLIDNIRIKTDISDKDFNRVFDLVYLNKDIIDGKEINGDPRPIFILSKEIPFEKQAERTIKFSNVCYADFRSGFTLMVKGTKENG